MIAKTSIKSINNDKERVLYTGDLSKFGQDFQIKLLALLIKDRIFAFSMLPIIEESYFSDVWIKKIYVCIKEYISQYTSIPTIDNLKILLKTKGERIITYEKILGKIENVDLSDRDFVIDNSRKFCFSKYALSKNEEAKILLELGEFDKAKKILFEVFKHQGTDNRKIYDLKTDYDKIFSENILHRPVETPFPTVNKITKGGPGSGNLAVIVAPSNFGKTALLTALARHANSVSKNVAFFSFEIGGIDIIRRYIAGQLGLKQEELKFNKPKVEELFINDQLGNFRLIEERATKATVEQIKLDIEYLKSTGFYPDLICVDSLNQLKLLGEDKWRMRDDNQKFEYLSEELRDLSGEEGVPLWAPFQTNRSGFLNKINDITTIGKAIEPFQVADLVMTFAQTPDMEQDSKCIGLVAKNRLGPKNIALEMFYDPNQGVFKELKEVPELLLLSSERKEEVRATVTSVREKLRTGYFDKR